MLSLVLFWKSLKTTLLNFSAKSWSAPSCGLCLEFDVVVNCLENSLLTWPYAPFKAGSFDPEELKLLAICYRLEMSLGVGAMKLGLLFTASVRCKSYLDFDFLTFS